MTSYDVNALRKEFPALQRTVYGKPLIYLDNTATSQTPRSVVEEITRLYYNSKANVHRGVHFLSQEMTGLQEEAREKIRKFINASSTEEIIFTRGTTEGINLVAASYGRTFFKEGDEVIISVMEHHSNIVPWQLLQPEKHIKLRVIPADEKGVLDMEAYKKLFNEHTAMVAVTHVSNVLGTINPVKRIAEEAHRHNVPVLIDGAQAVSHQKVDVQDIDCDFYVFSGHKMYGPTGVGVLYGKKELLEKMPPYQGGGEMIGNVTFEHTTWAELPFKFEAGTPDFIGIAALHKAIDFMESVGIEAIGAHEKELLRYATEKMIAEIPALRIYGEAPDKDAIISFMIGNEHPYDVGMLLDKCGVAIRTGHHCAQPLLHSYGLEGVARASFAAYNTYEEVDEFVKYLKRIASMLS